MTSPAQPANHRPASISAFFPCYNDARTIGRLVEDAHATLARLVDDFEVVVVDDGSTDDSRSVLDEVAQRLPHVHVVVHEHNRGYGGALISGFDAASKEWVFYTDGDGQYDPTELELLVEAVGPTTDVVQGYKIGRGGPFHRKLIGRLYHHTVKLLFALHVRDTDCDFRLFKRSLLAHRTFTSTSGTICVEMMRTFEQAGAEFVEVPVHHYWRPHGRSQYFRITRILQSMRELLVLWWTLMVRGPDSTKDPAPVET